MNSTAVSENRVVPAQLSFLAIYNPGLSENDDSVQEQIVFYSSKIDRERKKHKDRDDGAREDNRYEEDEINDRLRQVGLAQGMVNFAKNFSNGAPVDSIETERSRIVLHELEAGWWIIASIDLTRLPAARLSSSQDSSAKNSVEYSAREVSPPHLLLQQLVRAHSVFLLHHATCLDDLYSRLGRLPFCSVLERFWSSFISTWDVLLHGNPAADIYNGVKLAAGGELGVGVGEEDWGSGEREVLEDFVARTSGLVDLIVSRFGEEPIKTGSDGQGQQRSTTKHNPWLGVETDPGPSDGVIFSGVGAISRQSLSIVSQWMESIFQYGEDAYGVGENPASRHRRKRRKLSQRPANRSVTQNEQFKEPHPQVLSPVRGREPDLRRKAIENNATPPGIPPPLVNAVERSLNEAVAKAQSRESSRSPKKEKTEEEAAGQSSFLGTDKMMKYLSLGYGSAWTLSPKGLSKEADRDAQQKMTTATSVEESTTSAKDEAMLPEANLVNAVEVSPLQDLEPTPEVSDDDVQPYVQRLEESIGKFIIGLSGDLENTEFGEEIDEGDDAGPLSQSNQQQRIVIRTLTIETAKTISDLERPWAPEPPTGTSPSVGGSQPIFHHQKLQIAVYVHQPFIFIFLFDLHTANMAMPSFFRNIHHILGPLQKPLLRSTNPARAAERIAHAMSERTSSTTLYGKGYTSPTSLYNLIYDPATLTVRTTLPNIPRPGSLAAEGLASRSSPLTVSGSWYTLGIPLSSSSNRAPSADRGTSPAKGDWTRIEALNVHTQILNTWAATKAGAELERTVKTSRGWWILWMKVSTTQNNGQDKMVFLVRRAADHNAHTRAGRDNASRTSGKWLLREQSRDVSSGSAGGSSGTATSAAGVTEGVGVDARRYIEGLLALNS